MRIGDSEYWWITKFIAFQYKKLSEACPAQKKVFESIRTHQLPVKDDGTLSTTLITNLDGRVTLTQQEEEEEEEEGTERVTEKKKVEWNNEDGWTGITEQDREEWHKAYPACNITRQLAAANQWLLANPTKAHKSQWRRFIVNWLSRAQDRGGDTKSNRVSNPNQVAKCNGPDISQRRSLFGQ